MVRRVSSFADESATDVNGVLRLLRGCEAPHDDLSFFADKRVDGSCEWILTNPTMEAFLRDNSQHPRVVWCFGGPGSGKSVTASFVVEQLLEESRPCAYYYFRSGDQVKNGLGPFLTSIAFQLSESVPEYRRKLSLLGTDSLDVSKASHKVLWKKLFVSTLLQCGSRSPFFIVVDGLDEFHQTKELVQKMFVELGDASVRLRLLLVSRPTLDVDTSIERLSRRINVQRVALDANADDLEMYVRDEMDVMPGLDDFKEKIVMEILAKADRNFLWAHLVVQEILTCQTELQVELALQQVPKDLEPLYERMDRRLADQFRSRPQDQLMGHAIVKWVTCSRRPLHLDELETALADVYPRIMDMRQTIQRLCGEFVSVDKKGTVSMMHSSARDYLLSNSSLRYYVERQQAHQMLFSRCLGVMDFGKQDLNSFEESTRAFLRYAASSWPFHLKQSSNYADQSSLTIVMRFLQGRVVLDWMFMLARAGDIRAIVEASKSLAELLKIVDKADRERSPLTHRVEDKEFLFHWTQDLMRIVGKFGPQITQHPRTVHHLMPAFCPPESVIHRQFRAQAHGTQSNDTPSLLVRGRLKPAWDDCFAKFAVAGECLPHSVLSLDRYFAILTKESGTVHLYYSTTCEIARRLSHGEHVLTMGVDSTMARLATYGFKKTMIWDLSNGRLLLSIENPMHSRALSIAFQTSERGDRLLSFSDDRVVRYCALDALRTQWQCLGESLDSDLTHPHQVNAPYAARFSPDGNQIAISYRGANPAVWFVGSTEPRLVGHFDSRARRTSSQMQQHSRILYVSAFAWHPLTGHLLGAYYGGTIFKWHPQEGDFARFEDVKADHIKSSADGKLFVTSSSDGTFRIWDFEHFTPIYQLRYPVRIQDIEIGRNEARIYDLRQQFCHIWEPTSLLRAVESDDASSDAQSSKESEVQSTTAESVREREDFEPITAFAVQRTCCIYATGDDAGKIMIWNADGDSLAEILDGLMSIEKLAWCDKTQHLASVDLARTIKIRDLRSTAETQPEQKDSPKVLLSFSESDEVLQILFQPDGQALMVVTRTALKLYSLSVKSAPSIIPMSRHGQWILHPQHADIALGFCADEVMVLKWSNPPAFITRSFRRLDGLEASVNTQPRFQSSRQVRQKEVTEYDLTVHKVLVSTQTTLALVEIFGVVQHTQRRSSCLLVDFKAIDPGETSSPIATRAIPTKLADALYTSLGFIDADCLQVVGRASSFAEHRRSVSRHQHDLGTFAFVDRGFWVCSVDMGMTQPGDLELRRHFPVPRDWQNAEWLDMAAVTTSGDFLCPRNGDVAVVSNGFLEEFLE